MQNYLHKDFFHLHFLGLPPGKSPEGTAPEAFSRAYRPGGGPIGPRRAPLRALSKLPKR